MAWLIDVNVLLAILHARHRHSVSALRWLEEQSAPGSVSICRVVQMGALRILTRQAIMKEDTPSAAQCWAGWDQLMTDERFSMMAEPTSLETAWREVTSAFSVGQCTETDAYLAAFALSADLTLVTFDRGFTKLPNLSLRLLP